VAVLFEGDEAGEMVCGAMGDEEVCFRIAKQILDRFLVNIQF
jgi:hypothetical protein